jgi:hypothetical protein
MADSLVIDALPGLMQDVSTETSHEKAIKDTIMIENS